MIGPFVVRVKPTTFWIVEPGDPVPALPDGAKLLTGQSGLAVIYLEDYDHDANAQAGRADFPQLLGRIH